MDKNKYIKKIIRESLDELSSDFETYADFKQGMRNRHQCFVYSQVDTNSIENICKNGTGGSNEYVSTMLYGRGLYCVLTYEDCKSYQRCDAMVQYAVKKGAFENFLFFSNSLKEEMQRLGFLSRHYNIVSTIKRLFSKQDYDNLCRHYGDNLSGLVSQIEGASGNRTWCIEEDFWKITRGNPISDRNSILYKSGWGSNNYDEMMLDASHVDGFAYDSNYGRTFIFRNMDLLIPNKYKIKSGYNWDSTEWKYCLDNEEKFDGSNINIDAYTRFRSQYPSLSFVTKTVCGFALVKHQNRYNYASAWTNKLLSPLDFEHATEFDPLTQTASFEITIDDELTHFKIKSINKGKEFQIFYHDDEENSWEEISYSDFIDTMNDLKSEKGLNESVEEVFTHKSYNEFKNRNTSNDVYLYRASSVAKSEFEDGANFEWVGTGGDDSLYYGFGIYTVRDTNSILSGKYGNTVCKFVLKDGYKDFVILDDDVRKKYDPGHTVYDELVRLVPKDIFDDMDRRFKQGFYRNGLPSLNNSETQASLEKNGMEAFKNINLSKVWGGDYYNTASFARALKLMLQGHNLHDPLARHAFDELLLGKTKIRGFVYNGGSDGKCCLVRDTNSLMPVAYSEDAGRTWIYKTDRQSEDERFDKINKRIHPWYQYRSQHPKLGLRAKSSGNFTLVPTESGYNYRDIYFHRLLLPVDAENATDFSFNGSATFKILGETYEISVDDDLNITIYDVNEQGIKEDEYSPEEFFEIVKECINDGTFPKGTKFHENCLMNPQTKKNK